MLATPYPRKFHGNVVRGTRLWSGGAISVARSADLWGLAPSSGRGETPSSCAPAIGGLQVEVPSRLGGGAPTLVLDGRTGQRPERCFGPGAVDLLRRALRPGAEPVIW